MHLFVQECHILGQFPFGKIFSGHYNPNNALRPLYKVTASFTKSTSESLICASCAQRNLKLDI